MFLDIDVPFLLCIHSDIISQPGLGAIAHQVILTTLEHALGQVQTQTLANFLPIMFTSLLAEKPSYMYNLAASVLPRVCGLFIKTCLTSCFVKNLQKQKSIKSSVAEILWSVTCPQSYQRSAAPPVCCVNSAILNKSASVAIFNQSLHQTIPNEPP